MAMVFINMLMGPATWASGKMMFSTERARKPGQMAHFSKETMLTGRRMVREFMLGLMVLNLTEVGVITKSTVLAFTIGQTVEGTKGTGRTTICTVKVFTAGLMVDSTKETMRMTRNTGKACTSGLMVASTTGNGQLAGSTDKASINMRMEQCGRGFG